MISAEPPRTVDGDLGRILTIPNLLSGARIVGAALFWLLLFVDHDRIAAALVLAATGATDFLDGYLARRLGQVTTLGKILDPVADRIVLASGVIAITVYGAVPIWLGALVLAREAVVSIAVLVLAGVGAARIDVLRIGKAATFGLLVAFPLFLLGDGRASAATAVRDCAIAIVIPSLAASIVAALAYIPRSRQALRDGRESRGARS